MSRRTHTICWGLVCAMGLALPHASRVVATGGQSIATEPGRVAPPPAAPSSTPPPPPATKSGSGFGNRAEAAYELAWRAEKLPTTTSAELALTESAVIIAGDQRPTVARRVSDGEVLWTNPLGLRYMVAGGGRVYGVGGDRIYALDEHTGSTVWTATAADAPLSLTLTPERVIATSERGVTAFATLDGTLSWRHDLDSAPVTPAAASPSIVAVGLADKSIVVLDLAAGAVRWRRAMDDEPRWILATDDRLLVGLPKIAACAVSTRSGPPPDWCTFQARVPSVGPPLVEGRLLYLALSHGQLIALNRDTGTLVRSDGLEGRAAFQPGRVGSDVVVPLTNNTVAVVSNAGKITRLSSPAGLRVLQQAAIASAATTIFMLSTTMQEDMTLSAYRPKPPAAPAAPATASPPGGPAAPASQPPATSPPSGQPSASGPAVVPETTPTPTPAPSGR